MSTTSQNNICDNKSCKQESLQLFDDLLFANKIYVPSNATSEEIFNAAFHNSHEIKWVCTVSDRHYVSDSNDYTLMVKI